MKIVVALLIAVAVAAVSASSASTAYGVLFKSPHGCESMFQQTHGDWEFLGRADPNAAKTLLIAIKHKNVDALYSTLYRVSDPDHEEYGKHLSFGEIGDLFGDAKNARVVREWLMDHDIPHMVTKNHDWIRAAATTKQIEALLYGSEFYNFKNSKTGQVVARSAQMTIPERVAEAVDFIEHTTVLPRGLKAHFYMHEANGKQVTVSPTAPDSIYPAVLAKAYDIPAAPSSTPAGANIALFEALGQAYSTVDISKFESTYKLGSQTVTNQGPGASGVNGFTCLFNPNSCAEAELDLQYAIGVAHPTPVIGYFMKSTDETPFLDWASAIANDANAPKITSISYGGEESEEPEASAQRFDQEVAKLGVRGLSVFIASGDDGAAGAAARSDPTKCGLNAGFPVACPSVTGVGATQGVESNTAEIMCQSNKGGLITSGGGFSGYFAAPSYQTAAVQHYLSTASGLPTSGFNKTNRGYPDVSSSGHNYLVEINSELFQVSGTSASTPVIASFAALINNNRLAAGKSTVGFINPALYKAPSSAFTDITSGKNNCCASPDPSTANCCAEGYPAAAGWDAATGIGSPIYSKLATYFDSL